MAIFFPSRVYKRKTFNLTHRKGKKKEKGMKGRRRMALNPGESMYTNFTCDLHVQVRTITLDSPLF